MGVNDLFFKRDIKLAFSRVKEHISHVENQLKASKEEIIQYKEEISNLRKELESLREELKFRVETQKPSNPQNQGVEEVSSGNEGVYSFIHSFNSYSQDKPSENLSQNKFQGFKQDFEKIFGSLSSQEFLTFLTIYQLEEEISHVRYIDVARKLNLTEGCIRTYVSSLLKKGLPLIKKRFNNRQIFLHISPEFRSLNMKQKLINTFYQSDPHQKTLQDTH